MPTTIDANAALDEEEDRLEWQRERKRKIEENREWEEMFRTERNTL